MPAPPARTTSSSSTKHHGGGPNSHRQEVHALRELQASVNKLLEHQIENDSKKGKKREAQTDLRTANAKRVKETVDKLTLAMP